MTQEQRLLGWLYENKSINPLEAWQSLGVYRLAAVVHSLRKHGYDIKTERMAVKNQFGEACIVAKYVMEAV